MLQAMTTGQLLDRIFTLYRKNFLLFYVIALLPQFVYVLFFGVLISSAATSVGRASTGALIAITITLTVIGVAAYIGSMAISQGATVDAVSGLYLGQPVSARKAIRAIMPKTLRLVGIMFGYTLIIGLGFLLLIVPGVYWLITYALAPIIATVENASFSEAFTRSKDLVQGNRGRIAIIVLLSLAMTYAIAIAFAIPAVMVQLALKDVSPALGLLLQLIISQFGAAIATPIGFIGFSLAYYDARVRKEAFDLHYMMESDSAVAAAAAGSSSSQV